MVKCLSNIVHMTSAPSRAMTMFVKHFTYDVHHQGPEMFVKHCTCMTNMHHQGP